MRDCGKPVVTCMPIATRDQRTGLLFTKLASTEPCDLKRDHGGFCSTLTNRIRGR